jgi:hypothetical protein
MKEEAKTEERSFLALAAKIRKLQLDPQPETNIVLRRSIHEMMEKVAYVREKFDETIIRRELMSKGEGGVGTITGMKPVWEQKAWLLPSIEEQESLEKIEEIIKMDMGRSDELALTFKSSVSLSADATLSADYIHKSFYLKLRQAGINAAAVLAAILIEDTPPVYTTLEDFAIRGSTKEKTVIQIIAHHKELSNQQSNPLQWDKKTGECTIDTKGPGPPIHTGTLPTKFVVYSQFVALSKYLESVSCFIGDQAVPSPNLFKALRLHGIPFLYLNGEVTLGKKRTKILEEFKISDTIVVLLLSSVGTTGINLASANILIIMVKELKAGCWQGTDRITKQDPLFSNQAFRQILGRVWRDPQLLQVIVYLLVLSQTADTILLDIAENKDTLLNAFNSTNIATVKGVPPQRIFIWKY